MKNLLPISFVLFFLVFHYGEAKAQRYQQQAAKKKGKETHSDCLDRCYKIKDPTKHGKCVAGCYDTHWPKPKQGGSARLKSTSKAKRIPATSNSSRTTRPSRNLKATTSAANSRRRTTTTTRRGRN